MEDKAIIGLYWARSEEAIPRTEEKYGSWCRRIAYNILRNEEDSEEAVNDTYLQAWQSIPPARPERLKLYLGRITRNLSLNRLKYRQASKRDERITFPALDDLSDIVSGKPQPEGELFRKELVQALNGYLRNLPSYKRNVFLRRYWYGDSVKTIADHFGKKEGTISVLLHRLRTELARYLTERGIDV